VGGPWERLVVQAGVVDETFTLALGPKVHRLRLLPFAGFDADIGAAAERLLPR